MIDAIIIGLLVGILTNGLYCAHYLERILRLLERRR